MGAVNKRLPGRKIEMEDVCTMVYGGIKYTREVELPNGHKWRQRLDGGWCRFSKKTCNMAHSYIERRENQDFLIAEIDLSKCLTARGMYREFDEAFQFPPSKNAGSLDILLDFMRDLGWHKVRNFEVRWTNFENAMKRDAQEVNEVMSLLQVVQDYWTKKNDGLNTKLYYFDVEYMS